MAGKAGKAGKRVFLKNWAGNAGKGQPFSGTWLEKLDFYFRHKSHGVFHLQLVWVISFLFLPVTSMFS